jgi:hypothetical protein
MLDVRYLAGLFDGEGCVHVPLVRRAGFVPSYSIRAVFCLTHQAVIGAIAQQFGVAFCRLRKSHANANWQDAYQVQICGEKAAGLFRAIRPYVLVKAAQIDIALALQDDIARYRVRDWRAFDEERKEAIVNYREGLRLQLKALNARGAFVGMMANSVKTPCPALTGAEGQRRAKQELN